MIKWHVKSVRDEDTEWHVGLVCHVCLDDGGLQVLESLTYISAVGDQVNDEVFGN